MNRPTAMIAIVAINACQDSPTEPALTLESTATVEAEFAQDRVPGAVRVLNRNLYVGADVTSVFAVQDAGDIPGAVAQLWEDIQSTDFATRAHAIAKEVQTTKPHLVGLQEVALFRTQTPGDFLAGNPGAAEDTVLDFLSVLLSALADHGLRYVAVASVENIDVEVPMLDDGSPTFLSDIRLTDYDVILARSDVETATPRAANYGAAVPLQLGGVSMELTRGYAAIDARIGGTDYTFITTHLEPTDPLPGQYIPDFQVGQVSELLSAFADLSRRTILTGDFSTDEFGGISPGSLMVLGAGFVDLWDAGGQGPGVTCCEAPDLANPISRLDRRVDVIYYRDAQTAATGTLSGSTQVRVVGDTNRSRRETGLWPSDHAGVYARLLLVPALSRNGGVGRGTEDALARRVAVTP